MSQIKNISGLEDILENYDVFILDQWGVMHDGCQGFLKAIDCVNKLFLCNKTLIIISNSSKKKETTVTRLPELGFKEKYFTEVMTSGEMIWQSLHNTKHDQTKKLGKNCFHIYDESKEDGMEFLKGLEKFNFVKNINNADFILGCTPLVGKKIIDYIPILTSAKKNNIPFICANPDFETVENHSGDLTFCMGTISELYKNMGGQTFILGKPNVEIYNECSKKLTKIDKSRILAIGDSLHHDIKGAINFGIDSLLITATGIHQEFFDKINPIWETSNNNLQKLGIEPTFICSDFKF